MATLCPYCQHRLTFKDAKPGKYKPKCNKCGARFALTIDPDPARAPLVEKLDGQAPPAAKETDVAPPAPTADAKTTAVGPQRSTVVASEETNVGADPNATTIAEAEAAAPTRHAEFSTPDQRATEATTIGAAAASDSHGGDDGDLPASIGGYKIVKELGRGAMGAVYLARQVSLDREVALKVIQAKWAKNPVFVARFTREAYAAAQLGHHNMVHIYDLGSDADTNFFSMEFVRGETLSQTVNRLGKLDTEVAVGYIIQAARGLQYAHDHGMVHRDVKPANLMVNEQGVVKVADLGLVKTLAPDDRRPDPGAPGATPVVDPSSRTALAAAGADVTLANSAMGTPAYMAPEQSADAANVDHRADIYSLGCTMYVLLTGRPPFEGATALEVITKHRSAPVVRPEVLVKRIPKELSDITLKMVAKRPEDRYPNLGEVIRDLERHLGVLTSGPYSPKEEHVQLLEQSVAEFNKAPLARLRLPILLAFAGLCLVLLLSALAAPEVGLAGAVCLGLLTPAIYFAYSGWRERTHLFEKARELLALARWSDWLMGVGGGLLFALMLMLFGQLWIWIAFAVLAVGLAVAQYYVIDRRLVASRQASLVKVNDLLKSLRIKGIEENSLRQFVAKYCGDDWEEFFETLFGFEAKLEAREQWGRSAQGRGRNRFRSWREPIVSWIDARVRLAKAEKERQFLQKIEEKNLAAQGVDPMQARRQAERVAEALVDDAAEARVAARRRTPPAADPAAEARAKREKMASLLSAARKGESGRTRSSAGMSGPAAFLFGPKLRFLAGCALLFGFGLWAHQNKVFRFDKKAVQNVDSVDALSKAAESIKIDTAKSFKPLSFPVVGEFFDGFNPGVAGLVLVVLAMFGGVRMSLFAWPAAALILFGSRMGIPPLGLPGGAETACIVCGLALAGVGILVAILMRNR